VSARFVQRFGYVTVASSRLSNEVRAGTKNTPSAGEEKSLAKKKARFITKRALFVCKLARSPYRAVFAAEASRVRPWFC
jgi:hypothetical protein